MKIYLRRPKRRFPYYFCGQSLVWHIRPSTSTVIPKHLSDFRVNLQKMIGRQTIIVGLFHYRHACMRTGFEIPMICKSTNFFHFIFILTFNGHLFGQLVTGLLFCLWRSCCTKILDESPSTLARSASCTFDVVTKMALIPFFFFFLSFFHFIFFW